MTTHKQEASELYPPEKHFPVVRIPVQLTAEFCAGIFNTAIEGGVNYWAEVTSYRWFDKRTHHELPYSEWVAHLEDKEEDDGKTHVVDLKVVALGLQRLLSHDGGVHLDSLDLTRGYILQDLSELLERPDAGGMIDADAADCIVQAGLFGKIIYG